MPLKKIYYYSAIPNFFTLHEKRSGKASQDRSDFLSNHFVRRGIGPLSYTWGFFKPKVYNWMDNPPSILYPHLLAASLCWLPVDFSSNFSIMLLSSLPRAKLCLRLHIQESQADTKKVKPAENSLVNNRILAAKNNLANHIPNISLMWGRKVEAVFLQAKCPLQPVGILPTAGLDQELQNWDKAQSPEKSMWTKAWESYNIIKLSTNLGHFGFKIEQG